MMVPLLRCLRCWRGVVEYNDTSVLRETRYATLEDYRSIRCQHPEDTNEIDLGMEEVRSLPDYSRVGDIANIKPRPRYIVRPPWYIEDMRLRLAPDWHSLHTVTWGLWLPGTTVALIHDVESHTIRHETAHIYDHVLNTPRRARRWWLASYDLWEARAERAENLGALI